jgi:hypothetical protein
MTRQEFERAFAQLQRDYQARANNERCVACEDCERCSDSTFCKRSNRLIRCHYCVDTERSIDCTHSHASMDLIACSHCRGCDRCSRSAYLERCVDCSDCTYCFGCVGLSGAEFQILNEPYDRSSYFKLLNQLSRQLLREPLR